MTNAKTTVTILAGMMLALTGTPPATAGTQCYDAAEIVRELRLTDETEPQDTLANMIRNACEGELGKLMDVAVAGCDKIEGGTLCSESWVVVCTNAGPLVIQCAGAGLLVAPDRPSYQKCGLSENSPTAVCYYVQGRGYGGGILAISGYTVALVFDGSSDCSWVGSPNWASCTTPMHTTHLPGAPGTPGCGFTKTWSVGFTMVKAYNPGFCPPV
jgi:hypothetical protein